MVGVFAYELVSLDAKKDVNIKAGGKIILNAQEGIFNRSQTIKLEN
jgi:hypothetical protein